MPDSKLSPLAFNVPIVDPKTGFPTAYFMQMVATWLKENAFTDTTVETVQAEVDALEAEVAALELDDLVDVDTTGVADGDVLTYDSGSGDWVPEAPIGGSGNTAWTLVDQSGAAVAAKTFTITIASPGVVTCTGHGYANNTPVSLSTTGALPTGLSTLTTYYTRNVTANTFELSATSGGASINTTGTQSGTHSVIQLSTWTWSANVANVNVINLSPYNELIIFAIGVSSASGTGVRGIRVSVNNGSSFYGGASDYNNVNSAGVVSGSSVFINHGTGTTAARTVVGMIDNLKGAVKTSTFMDTANRRYFNASIADIDAIQLIDTGGVNLTAGSLYVYAR